MATSPKKTKAGSKQRIPAISQANRVLVELSMMRSYVLTTITNAAAALEEFRGTALNYRPDYAITSFAERAYRAQLIEESFGKLATRLKADESEVDILAEFKRLRETFHGLLIERCFTHNSTNPMKNALNVFKGEFAATFYEEMDRIIKSYESYADISEEQYNRECY